MVEVQRGYASITMNFQSKRILPLFLFVTALFKQASSVRCYSCGATKSDPGGCDTHKGKIMDPCPKGFNACGNYTFVAKSKNETEPSHTDRTCAILSTSEDWFGKTVGSDKLITGTYIQGPNVSCQTKDNERRTYTICICKGNLCNMVRFLFNTCMIFG